jgi:chemotaxis protein MotB
MSHALRAAALIPIFAAVMLAGCVVTQETYAELERKYTELKTERDGFKSEMDALKSTVDEKDSQLRSALAENALMKAAQQKSADTADIKIDDPDISINTMTNALMISDSLLFSSGSSTLKDEAKKTLEKLVPILNSAEHAKAFIRIDGHTDDQPVVKTKDINRDNWLLSAKRAHAVMEKFVELGVEQDRFIICGYGPILPVEPNEPGGKGNSKNRRVEIMLIENPSGIQKK